MNIGRRLFKKPYCSHPANNKQLNRNIGITNKHMEYLCAVQRAISKKNKRAKYNIFFFIFSLKANEQKNGSS